MFCTQCGVQLGDQEPNFCPSCGKATGRADFGRYTQRPHRLERPREGRRIAGVCAAFADYFDVDVTLVRLLALIFLFCGVGGLAYIIAAIVIPNEEIQPMQSAVRTN